MAGAESSKPRLGVVARLVCRGSEDSAPATPHDVLWDACRGFEDSAPATPHDVLWDACRGFEDSAPATPHDVLWDACRGFEDSAPATRREILPRSHDRIYPSPHVFFVLEGI